MPLIQSASKEALQKNIATEIKAGKDPKQASAIAYSVQRENDSSVNDARYVIYAKGTENGNRALYYKKEGSPRYSYERDADEFTEEEANRISNYKGKYVWVKVKIGDKGMKNFKVTYDSRSFIVKAKDKKDAAEKVMHKVIDEGELVSKYEKEVNGTPVTSAIIKHKKGFSFISGIIREDRDFNDLESAKAYAQRLGYITLNDSKIKDKRIPAKLKAELLAKTEEFIDTYNIRGFVKIDIVKNMITVEAEIGYNMLDKLMNDLTTVLNKYGHGATFDLAPNGKATAILRDAKLKMNDTLEILQKDNYKVILDGSWLEIVTTSGETIYSGNTTARTVREAYDMAKKQHIIDANTTSYKVNYRGRTFLVDAVSKKEAAEKVLKNILK